MKKPDGEIPESYAGFTSTDHTPFAQTAEYQKVLAEMSERLHYSKNVFVLGKVQRAGTGETEAIAVTVWQENFKMRVEAPNDSPAAFAVALEAELRRHDKYRKRLEQVEGEQDD